jgi:hypothetical protein
MKFRVEKRVQGVWAAMWAYSAMPRDDKRLEFSDRPDAEAQLQLLVRLGYSPADVRIVEVES